MDLAANGTSELADQNGCGGAGCAVHCDLPCGGIAATSERTSFANALLSRKGKFGLPVRSHI
jgi:hypothetical protein